MEVVVLVFWILLSIAVGAFASKYGRNFFGWFLLALVISPILGFIFVFIAGHGVTGAKKYKIAISCSDEEYPLRADYIKKVKKSLKRKLGEGNVFFYKDENENLLCKHSEKIYKEVYNNAQLMVCFATSKYRKADRKIIVKEKEIALDRFEYEGTALVVFDGEEIKDWQIWEEYNYLKVAGDYLNPVNLASALVKKCEEFEQQNPQKTRYSYQLFLKGEYKEARKEFPETGLEYQDYNFRGVVMGAQGENEEAIKDYSKAIEKKPDYAEAHYNRGNAKGGLGDWKEAISDYSRAIELKPNFAEAHYNRGVAKGLLGDWKEAISDYSRAIELKPGFAEAHNNRGNAKGELGNWEEAISDYSSAIERKPDHAEAHNNRGNAKGLLGDWKEAISDYSRAIELKPDFAEAHNNRGHAKGQLGDWEGSISDYSRANELKPDYAEAHNNRGIAKEQLGDREGAIKDFSKAIELKPDYAEAHKNRGNAKAELGDQKGAEEDLRIAERLKRRDSD